MPPNITPQKFVRNAVLACSGKNELNGRADVGGGVNQRAVDIEQINWKMSQAIKQAGAARRPASR